MSSAEGAGLSSTIAAIWTKHRPLMFERVATIEAALAAHEAGSLTSDARAAARRDAHKLAGSLGTFGLQQGTTLARQLELAFAADEYLEYASLEAAARGLRA
ncbi:MAG: Hpt domain-containing protein, partial [Longimicrobiales bacterium]